MTEGKKGQQPGRWARGVALALLGTGLLIGCSPSDPPTPTDPYAGGKSYPWTGKPDDQPKPLLRGENFLSDLSYRSASNAWGPIELDRSNGSQQSGDGQSLKLGTQTFAKGIGVHAGSALTYALNGSCSTFSATVGIDEEAGTRGSVVFEVYGDGQLLRSSGKMTGATAAKVLTASVKGVKELQLVVADAGDGIADDHADWADAKVTCDLVDSVPPVAPQGLTATASSGGIALNWADNTEADLAGYRVSRSASAGGPFTVLTSTPLTASSYTDTAAPQGTVSYYQVVAVDRSGNASTPSTASATRPQSSTVLGRASLENLDGGPFADRLVFSRIGSLSSPPTNGVHDHATLRVSNTGTGTLQITGLPITDTWELDPKLTLPLDIAPGKFQDVRLRFTAQSVKVHAGTLTVETDDPTAPRQIIQLAGLWQSQSESGQEPSLEQIVQGGFGFKTAFAPGSDINQKGRVAPQGDEVIAPYWQRTDAARPVTVQQLVAYHTQGNTATLRWFTKGGSDNNSILTQAGIDSQSVLPRKNGTNQLAQTTFSPAARTFGFKVDSENSDPVLNDQTKDRGNGCQDPCGQHLRFFKARDRSGAIMPDTYLLIMDYSGINYDYNDNIYLVSNLKPAPILINVGGVITPDPAGNIWVSDRDRNGYALFTPTTAKDEPAGGPNASLDILKTDFDALYRSYRGNVGNVPQSDRKIDFSIPLENGPRTLKLHFADLAHTEAGKRIFDVTVEGQKVLSNLDIVKEAGGGNTALVKTVDTNVTGGVLNLNLSASVDYPSIAGIEILR